MRKEEREKGERGGRNRRSINSHLFYFLWAAQVGFTVPLGKTVGKSITDVQKNITLKAFH